MVWDNRKIAVISGLGVLFLIEISIGICIILPSTLVLPELLVIAEDQLVLDELLVRKEAFDRGS